MKNASAVRSEGGMAMNKQDVLNEKAKAAIDKKAVYGADVDWIGV